MTKIKLAQNELKIKINEKLDKIQQNDNKKENVLQLCDIGKEYGFSDDNNIRLKSYQILLGISDNEINMPFELDDISKQIKNKIDINESLQDDNFKQMIRDCNGQFRLLDACMNQDEEQIQLRRNQLIEMMIKLFRENTKYNYYRGYDNFCSIFLWHFGKDKGYKLIEKLSATLLRQDIQKYYLFFIYIYLLIKILIIFIFKQNTDALQVEIDKSVSIQVNNIFEIIKQEDSQVAQIFSVTHFLAFCVGWVLTWFAFNIRKSKDILRIYDFLISSPPESVVILGAAFILGTKDIMKEHIQESQEGGEIGVLYGIYQNMWQVDYDLDHVINVALSLQKKKIFTQQMRSEYSPEQLHFKFTYQFNSEKYLINKTNRSIIHEKVLVKLIPIRKCLCRKDFSYLNIPLTILFILIMAFMAQRFNQ